VQGELNHLQAHWPNALPRGVVHADLFPDNVFFDDTGKLSGVIDFYFACSDLFAYDLAITMNAWCFERTGEWNMTKARSLLAAYQRVRVLSAEEIATLMDGYTVVVTKSTVPVGTGDEVEAIIKKARPDAEFAVVSNPEFLREGAAISDFKRPDRVVVGTHEPRAREVMTALYRPLYLNETPLVFTERRTSELIKYAANAFLAMKITFINEIADLCEAVGANVQEVAKGIGLDNRIGKKFLNAGPGYGGSCFPKDTLALMKTARDVGAPIELIETTVRVNSARKQAMAQKIVAAMGGDLSGKTVAVLGLTFKPNTDDMRDAPSLDIIPALQAEGATIRAFDPEGMHEAEGLLHDVRFAKNAYEAVEGADAVALLTEWDQFRALDLGRIKAALKSPVIIDLRNIYKPAEMKALGFDYVSVGRPSNID